DAGPSSISAAKHAIQLNLTAGHMGTGGTVLQHVAGNRDDVDAVLTDDEGIFIAAISRTTILDHSQSARGDLTRDALVDVNDTIRHEVQKRVPEGRLVLLDSFDRHDCGQSLVQEPFVHRI